LKILLDDDAIEMANHPSLVLSRSCDRISLSAKRTHFISLLSLQNCANVLGRAHSNRLRVFRLALFENRKPMF